MTIRKTIRELRDKLGLTQQDLAVKLDISVSTVASMESGRHEPRLELARKLAAVLGVSMDAIEWPEWKSKKAA
jgi:DNA-binding XRE family transcriptional regulator